MKFKIAKKEVSDLKIINAGVKYFGDGSGRDSYVIVNYGGTVKRHLPRNQLLKNYQDNKNAMQHNRNRSQKSFTANPTFARKRAEFQIKSINKLTSHGGILPEYNNPYPFDQNDGMYENRVKTAKTLKRNVEFGSQNIEYKGNYSAANLPRRPFNSYQSMDQNKWRQVMLKNWNLPHKNF